MITNIVEAIRKKLGYPPLEKVDPNIQETKHNEEQTIEEKLAQSAIPVVLAGFFKYTRTDEGSTSVFNGKKEDQWLGRIFGDRKAKAVEKVAQYAGVSVEEAGVDMEQVAREAFLLVNESASGKHAPEKIKNFMSNQRHNILVHLPAAMQLGDLLEDNAMDDRTNKMEGPVSSFMHTIENKLSGGGS